MYSKSEDVFLDREDVFNGINDILSDCQMNHSLFRIINIWGMGGIGKTSILKQLKRRYTDGYWSPIVFPMEIRKGKPLMDILLDLRKTIPFPSSKILRFDAAITLYAAYMGRSENNNSLMNDLLPDIVMLLLSKNPLQAVPIGWRLLQDAVNKIRNSKEILKADELASVENALEDGHNIMVCKVFLELLAKDFSEIFVTSTSSTMLIIDAYDQNVRKEEFDWLYTFMMNVKHGAFIVSSREKLPWKDNGNCKVQDFYLNKIPEKIVREELEKQFFTPAKIESIVSATECIPIFLSLVLREDCNITPKPLKVGGKAEIIETFLSHFSEDEKHIVEYISVIEYFSEPILDHIQDFFRIPLKLSFDKISSLSLFEYVEDERKIYHLHSILARNISELMDGFQIEGILLDLLSFVSLRMIHIEETSIERSIIITNLFNKFYLNKIEIDDKTGELLLKAYFSLLERGEESALLLTLVDYSEDKMTKGLRQIIEYIRAKEERRSDIPKSLRAMVEIEQEKPYFGKYIKAIRCDINYLLSISGNYIDAYTNMRKFVEKLDEREVLERYYRKGYTYLHDIQMLMGSFKTAIKGFLELEQKYENTGTTLYEINKAIGHCYRFCFLFDNALIQYRNYRENTVDEIYGLTVLCETLCFVKPDDVKIIYSDAVKQNVNSHNHNNLGKIKYSRALAELFEEKPDLENILLLLSESHNEFEKTGYYAGHLFTWQAECYVAYAQNNLDIIKSLSRKMRKSIKHLDGVYGYLMLPVYRMLDDNKQVKLIKNNYEWPDFKQTLKNLDSYLRRLQNRLPVLKNP